MSGLKEELFYRGVLLLGSIRRLGRASSCREWSPPALPIYLIDDVCQTGPAASAGFSPEAEIRKSDPEADEDGIDT